MKTNIRSIDSAIRLTIGVALLALVNVGRFAGALVGLLGVPCSADRANRLASRLFAV